VDERKKRQRNRLTAAEINRLQSRGRKARYADGNRLYLAVDVSGAARWVFIYRWKLKPDEPGPGRQREMSLGSLDHVSLADARRRAREARSALAAGQDPILLKHGGQGTSVASVSRRTLTPTRSTSSDAPVANTESGAEEPVAASINAPRVNKSARGKLMEVAHKKAGQQELFEDD